VPGFALASPSEVTVDNLQPQVEYNFYGAVTAAQAVLPAMRKAGAGTLRNWVINLNKELTGSGVCAGHVVINVWIGDGAVERTDAPEDVPTATPDQIAPLYWDLHENRNRPEAIFST
jgi:NAD(P)-dependent dehydrogenase (short-subunit alcohol dehydrogenase family)